MKAKVDPDLCIGCELCANICPEVFRMEEGKAVVHVPVVPQVAEASCRQAAEDCPADAITVEP
ncbi:MAG: ferredoxin [Elusimicrobia bacterium]|nr:ferredoxin [Elusimicrobiota bacterium]